jgi:eukaryotic-like serine/threonine-protein kinase
MTGCPDPGTLARFADGQASEAAAGELRAHVDGCANCREVLVTLAQGDKRPAQLPIGAGTTLGQWLKAAPRPWGEVLEKFLAAGRGLAAAHAAGLVHRDFKPDNVLLDAQGGVHVTGFGLAPSAHAGSSPAVPAAAEAVVSSGLSRQTAVLGTPAYMAPEQLRAQPVDHRADQFSFCVALWEAVYGERPFAAQHTSELLTAIERGPQGSTGAAPGWLEKVLRRGLSLRPESRFASLEQLLAELDDGVNGRARRTRTLVMLAAGAVVVLALLVPRLLGPSCEASATRAAAIWNDAARAQAEQKFQASGSANATPAWVQVSSTLDAWSRGWRESWTAMCKAPGGPEARARATLCLEARLTDFELMVELFKNAEGAVVEAAPYAFARLYGTEACVRGETLTTVPLPEKPEARLQVARARLLAAQSDAARLSGRHASAMRMAKEAVALAESSGYRPAQADALLALAEEERVRANDPAAAATLDRALLAAEGGRHFEAIARIATQQVFAVGTHSMRPADGEAWLTRAKGALEQLPRPELEAEVQLATVFLRSAQGRPEEGLEAGRQSAETFFKLGRPARGYDAQNLHAQALALSGRPREAVALEKTVVAGRTELLGPDHLQVLRARLELGQYLVSAGMFDEAVPTLIAALDKAKTAGIPPLSSLIASHALAKALTLSGRHTEAVIAHRAVLAGIEPVLGTRHRYYATGVDALAEGLREAGKLDEAEKEHTRAMQIWLQADGTQAENRAASHALFAWTLIALGKHEAALAQAQAALVPDPGDKRPFVWVPIVTNAQGAAAAAHLKAGRLDEAQRAAAAAVAASLGGESPEIAVARARAWLVLGQAQRAAKADSTEAFTRGLAALTSVSADLNLDLQARLRCEATNSCEN